MRAGQQGRCWACPFRPPRTASPAASCTGPTRPRRTWKRPTPACKVIVKTAGGAPEQANQLQDLLTVNKINALVIFPFESAALTKPVAQVKRQGRVRDGGGPRPDRHQRARRLRGRRQHRLRQDAGRVHRQGAGRQGQRRGACAALRPRWTTSAWTRSTRC